MGTGGIGSRDIIAKEVASVNPIGEFCFSKEGKLMVAMLDSPDGYLKR